MTSRCVTSGLDIQAYPFGNYSDTGVKKPVTRRLLDIFYLKDSTKKSLILKYSNTILKVW